MHGIRITHRRYVTHPQSPSFSDNTTEHYIHILMAQQVSMFHFVSQPYSTFQVNCCANIAISPWAVKLCRRSRFWAISTLKATKIQLLFWFSIHTWISSRLSWSSLLGPSVLITIRFRNSSNYKHSLLIHTDLYGHAQLNKSSIATVLWPESIVMWSTVLPNVLFFETVLAFHWSVANLK